jgi:hypothetical protein
MSNIQLANEYAKQMSAISKVWISDNLPTLPRNERKAIIKVYKKHFKFVDYNFNTGVCKCYNTPDDLRTMDSDNTMVADSMDISTGVRGDKIKSSTFADAGIAEREANVEIVTGVFGK